jgi:hypothetical protein
MPGLPEEIIQNLCYEQGSLKPKAECRAGLINHLILEDACDIDEAENITDRTLRSLNLWNEPRIEDLLRDDEETPGT